MFQKSLRTISTLITGLIFSLPATAAEIRQLSVECERAVALSAGPQYLRADAGVYILGESGYVLDRESENGYLCIVERNHPDGLIPQCFDNASIDAHIAVLLDEGKLIRSEMSFKDIRERREQLLADGTYQAAAGPGVVYMVSDYNYIQSTRNEVLLKVAPHVMYHAPGLSDADIGSDRQLALGNRGLPIIASEGPQGFMISFTEKASDSAAVHNFCAGQLVDQASLTPFPPL